MSSSRERSTPSKKGEKRVESHSSPFDLDLGGGQREELRAQRDGLLVDVQRLREEQRLKDMQISVLRTLQKQETRATRVARWSSVTLTPAFTAWCRSTVVARAARAAAQLEQQGAEARAMHAEKERQVSALVDRVATVKANAHSKLSGLSEANRKLAAALERKDKELVEAEAEAKHLRRSAGRQGEKEVELQLELDRIRDELCRTQHALVHEQSQRRAEAQAAEARITEAASVGARAGALVTSLMEALSAADAQLLGVNGRVAELEAHCERQAAHAAGLQAETACLKAEAAAERTVLQLGQGARPPVLARPSGLASMRVAQSSGVAGRASRAAKGGETGQKTEEEEESEEDCALLVAGALELEIGRWRRALLSAIFWGWRDRVTFCAELSAERERNVLVVQLHPQQGSARVEAGGAGILGLTHDGRDPVAEDPAAEDPAAADPDEGDPDEGDADEGDPHAREPNGGGPNAAGRVAAIAAGTVRAVEAVRGGEAGGGVGRRRRASSGSRAPPASAASSGSPASGSPVSGSPASGSLPAREATTSEVMVGAVMRAVMEGKYRELEERWVPQLQR